MTEYQRLFLVQARSAFSVFHLLQGQSALPRCHALHYLQMATELLGKAHAWKHGPNTTKHRAFVGFLKSLATNRKAQKHLGFQGLNAKWEHLTRNSLPLAECIEGLAPALAQDSPNPEYPWPRSAPEITPAEHTFREWQELDTPAGREFLKWVSDLFAAADAYL